MLITFTKKKMVITHKSGRVDTYDEDYLKKLRAEEVSRRDEVDENISQLDGQIEQVRNS